MSILSIIIPVLNEEESIGSLIDNINKSRDQITKEAKLKDIEVIAVDDGSQDNTSKILEKHKTSIRIVTHNINMGYGAALKSGFEAATGDYLSFLDADGTCSPESFIKLVNELRENDADIAVGSRMDRSRSQMPAVRWIGNKFFASILSFLSGKSVTDSASGIRVFKKDVIEKLYPLPDGLHFTPAMTAKALHEGLKIVETPVPYSERGGKSKLSVVKDGYRFLRIIIDTVMMYNPFKVFLLLGLLSILVSALLIAFPVYNLIGSDKFVFSDYIYRSIGSLYFFIAGVQIILFGVLIRFIVSTFFKRHEAGKLVHWVNRSFKVYERIGWYGLLPILIGILINAVYAYKHFFGKGITIHWAYLLVAAALIIMGVQMGITGVLIKILKDIKYHISHRDEKTEPF